MPLAGRRRATATLAWLLAVAVVLLAGFGFSAMPAGDPLAVLNVAAAFVAALTLTLTGAVLITRLPGPRIGWLLAIGGLLFAFANAGAAIALALLDRGIGLATWVVWLADLCWVPAIVCVAALTPLLFPTGHLPSPRWRLVVAVALASIVLSALQSAFSPYNPGSTVGGIANPLAVTGSLADFLGLLGGISNLAGVVCLPLVAASLVGRYRRATGLERAQLRWFAAAVAIIGPAFAFGIVASQATTEPAMTIANLAFLVTFVGFALLPVAIGIAVLRYHLYDIDLLINRTAVYGVVSLVLIAVFGAAYLVLQRLVETSTGQRSDLVAIVAVGGAAVASGPLRRRVRPLVDRVLPARALLTLLFTDIVGSTKTVVELGDARWRGLLDRYLATVRTELSHHRGHEVNTAGDAFFATFERPADGLACAWAIRSAVRGLGLETRTGLHRGECEMRGEQPSGLAVHTAARVMAAAGDGEILVSDALREALDASDLSLADRGRHELRGVPGEWQLYAAEPLGKTS